MEDDAAANNGHLRPLSQPTMNSRFPSLRRLNSTEPYRHRSLPADTSPGSDRASSEVTFAVLYDDGPDYHVGHYDDEASMRTAHNRPDSMASYAPSFHTRDSRVVSDEHYLDNRNPDFIANQRLLAEGYLNNNDSLYDQSVPRYPTQSEETLAMNTLHNSYARDEKRPLSQMMSPPLDRPQTKHSHESWCTCDEDHGHGGHGQSQTLGVGAGAGIMDRKDPAKYDLEAQNGPATPTPFLQKEKKPSDPFIVKFDGPDDPLDPKNWPSSRKWAVTGLTAAFTFLSPLASSMVAPALPQIRQDFAITNMIESQIVLSIFVLAYAIGPMFLGPLSELYGRVIVLQASNIVFLAFNTACGFAQSKEELMAFRFLSGLGGSAPLAIGGGILGDLFRPEERGKAMGVYAMGPLLGPAVGPIVGAWVAEKSTWRWMFWATSVVNLLILACGFWKFHESYAPYILHKKAKALRKRTNDPRYRAEGEAEVDQPIWKKVVKTMGRAFGMLFTQPIVQIMAVYMAFSYGILYLALSTFPELYMQVYGESVGVSGLNYISLGLGFFIGAPLCGKTSDTIYHKLKARDPEGKGKPEFRMPIVIPFSFFVPIGMLIYGWSAQAKTHWIVPNIGSFIFGIGTIAAFQCVTTYLVDTYARYAASAVAAVTILRSLAGFSFPLFAPAMYSALDFGWGNTVLALAAVGIGIPVPILLWIFGEKLRQRSGLAAKGPPPGKRGPGGPGGPGRSGPPAGMGPDGRPVGPPPPFPGGRRGPGPQ